MRGCIRGRGQAAADRQRQRTRKRTSSGRSPGPIAEGCRARRQGAISLPYGLFRARLTAGWAQRARPRGRSGAAVGAVPRLDWGQIRQEQGQDPCVEAAQPLASSDPTTSSQPAIGTEHPPRPKKRAPVSRGLSFQCPAELSARRRSSAPACHAPAFPPCRGLPAAPWPPATAPRRSSCPAAFPSVPRPGQHFRPAPKHPMR